jgi:serine/threonine protein kinase
MASLSIDEFLARLESTQALDAQSLDAVRKEVAPVRHEIDSERYARKLVKQGTLTQWQADQIVSGRKNFVMGEYRLLELAGRGGMGAVFKAEHVRLKRIVALKTLAPELVNQPAQVARFQKEIEAASALESPNVVRALDAIRVGKTYVLVMEFVDGEPLSTVGKRRGRIEIGEACEYIRQAALGLQHAHERGMVHRDIKPGNLILTWGSDGSPLVKVFDLGLARFVSERVDHNEMTRTGQVMGTPDYMSPEQGWDTRTVDIRGDVYSLGCTAFWLITGRVPFSGDNPLQTLMLRCSNDAPPIRAFLPEVPEPLEAVIAKMLARDPAERFQTPGELANAITPFCNAVSQTQFQKRSGKRVKPVALPVGVTAGTEDQSETGYEKFLTKTSSGSADSLSSDGSNGETVPDVGGETPLAAFPQLAEPASTPAVTQSPEEPKQSGLDRRVIGAGVLAVACLLGVLLWMTRGDEEVSGDAKRGLAASVPTPPAALLFVPVSETEVDEGKLLRLMLRLAGDSKNHAGVSFRLAGLTPDGLTLNGQTGELQWEPTEKDGPGRYEVKVEAVRTGQQKPAAKQTVTLVVNEVDQPPQVAVVAPTSVTAGEKLQLTVVAFDADLPASPLRFQLAPGAPRGAVIDRLTGEFEWTPPINSSPTVLNVLVLVSTEAHPNSHAARTIRIGVRPSQPQLRLVAVPALNVVSGQTLRTTLKTIGAPAGSKLAFEFLTAPPDGAALDSQTGEFSWNTASTLAAGKYEIGVRVRIAGDASRFAAGKLAINVTTGPTTPGSKPGAVASATPTGPTDDEIRKAEQQARDLFRKEIVTARSVAERVDLAARLLTRAKESGATPLALGLFHLAREYALKGRSVALALEAVRIGSGRFGEDLVTQTTECLRTFKPRGSTWFDEQQIIEVGLGVALVAVEAGRFKESEKLIALPETVLRRGKRFREADQLKSALDFLKTVRTEVPDEKKRIELSESAKLALKELTSTLRSFRFEPIFVKLDDVDFFRHSDRDLPDLGRSLWKIDNGSTTIDTEKQSANTGFVDRAHSLTAYTLRMNVSTDTTVGMLCIGVPQTGSFEGLRLHLAAAQFCFVRKASGTEFLARPTSPITRSRAGWDQIELRVRSGQITILVNNVPVIESSIKVETSGFVGLDTFLGKASPARIRLENVRVRVE